MQARFRLGIGTRVQWRRLYFFSDPTRVPGILKTPNLACFRGLEFEVLSMLGARDADVTAEGL